MLGELSWRHMWEQRGAQSCEYYSSCYSTHGNRPRSLQGETTHLLSALCENRLIHTPSQTCGKERACAGKLHKTEQTCTFWMLKRHFLTRRMILPSNLHYFYKTYVAYSFECEHFISHIHLHILHNRKINIIFRLQICELILAPYCFQNLYNNDWNWIVNITQSSWLKAH